MVALNWQTYDVGVQINEAMFASGEERSGYVLKPKELRPYQGYSSEELLKIRKQKKQVKFQIEVISGQQLPRPNDLRADESFDPYVEVEVFIADDKAKGRTSISGGIEPKDSKNDNNFGLGAPLRRRTVTVAGNGFSPLFSREGSGTISVSLQTKFESLVFVRFSVHNESKSGDSSLIASYTAKLISLQQGEYHL